MNPYQAPALQSPTPLLGYWPHQQQQRQKGQHLQRQVLLY
jgi:hypothetical protein